MDVVSKPSLPELVGFTKNDMPSISGKADSSLKPRGSETVSETTTKETASHVEESENSIKRILFYYTGFAKKHI